VNAAILAFSCFLGGALFMYSSEIFVASASEPAGQIVMHERGIALVGRSLESPRDYGADPPGEEAQRVPRPRHAVTDQARDALLVNPALTKSLLMPVVASGLGTAEDVRILKAACEGLKDRACLDFLRWR
jgi:hypothetical protein